MKIARKPRTIRDLYRDLGWAYSTLALFCVIFAAKDAKADKDILSIALDLFFACAWAYFAVSSFRSARNPS